MGWLGGQWRTFGQNPTVTPHTLGFLMSTESQDLGLTSQQKDCALPAYGTKNHQRMYGDRPLLAIIATRFLSWANQARLTKPVKNCSRVIQSLAFCICVFLFIFMCPLPCHSILYVDQVYNMCQTSWYVSVSYITKEERWLSVYPSMASVTQLLCYS